MKPLARITTAHNSYSEIILAFQAMSEQRHDQPQNKCIRLVRGISVRDMARYNINDLTLLLGDKVKLLKLPLKEDSSWIPSLQVLTLFRLTENQTLPVPIFLHNIQKQASQCPPAVQFIAAFCINGFLDILFNSLRPFGHASVLSLRSQYSFWVAFSFIKHWIIPFRAHFLIK